MKKNLTAIFLIIAVIGGVFIFSLKKHKITSVPTLKNADKNIWEDRDGYYYEIYGAKGLAKYPFDPYKAKQVEEDSSYYIAPDGVYYMKEFTGFVKLEGADPDTFHYIAECSRVEIYGTDYMGDKNHIYVVDRIIPEADPATFRMVTSFDVDAGEVTGRQTYSKDKDTVFKNCGEVIKDADAPTFEYPGTGRVRDKNKTYWTGEFDTPTTPVNE